MHDDTGWRTYRYRCAGTWYCTGAIDETVPYVKARKQFGRSIAKFQNTQFQLADMQVKTDAARWLVYDAAMKKEKGLPYSVEAAKAKLFAAEVAMEVTTKAIQLMWIRLYS